MRCQELPSLLAQHVQLVDPPLYGTLEELVAQSTVIRGTNKMLFDAPPATAGEHTAATAPQVLEAMLKVKKNTHPVLYCCCASEKSNAPYCASCTPSLSCVR